MTYAGSSILRPSWSKLQRFAGGANEGTAALLRTGAPEREDPTGKSEILVFAGKKHMENTETS